MQVGNQNILYMRQKIVAGNWKMNTTVPEGVELAKAVVAKSVEVPSDVKLVIATPATHLVPVADVVKGSVVALSAENCADKEKGAYTGEIADTPSVASIMVRPTRNSLKRPNLHLPTRSRSSSA